MRFVGYLVLFTVLAFCGSVHAYTSLSIQSLSSSFSPSPRASVTPIYGSAVHHLPLKAHDRMAAQPKRIQRGHNGMHIETVDAVIAGCPSLDFSAKVGIGSQVFDLIVDTGSTTLGVASSSCSCGTSPSYTPGTTASFVTQSTTAFTSKYGDGSTWSAGGYSDQVSMSGSVSAATTFAAISTENGFFKSTTCSGSSGSSSQGIIGFAGPRLALQATDGSSAVSQQWFAQYQAAAAVPDIFAIQMCLQSGDIWLGGYDNTTFVGELHWVTIQSTNLVSGSASATLSPGEAYYTIAVNSIGLTGFTADAVSADYQSASAGVNTIVDSGTTLMLIPTAAYKNIVNALTNNYVTAFNSLFSQSPSNFFSSSCFPTTASLQTINSQLPTMEVVLGGAANGVPLSITLHAASSYLRESIISGTTYFCPGIADRGSSTTNILGWSFINQLIVAHDLRNLKLGFGLRSGCKDGSYGAVNVTGGETGVADAAIQGGSVTNQGAAGGGSDSGGTASTIFNSISALSTTIIIIIVVSVVAGLIVLLALCWCCQQSSNVGERTTQAALQRQQEQEFGKF